MTTAAVVVDYDLGGALVHCLRSLQTDGVGSVVVVENGDGGRCRKLLLDEGLDVHVVAPGRNLGYGAGANRGVAALGGTAQDANDGEEYVLIANGDIAVHPGALANLEKVLENDPTLAMAGPRLLTADGEIYPTGRRFPSMIEAAGHVVLGLLRPDNSFTKRYHGALAREAHETVPVDWVSGSCFLVRRRAFEQLGGFDESFFMYAEDLDLCWRARQAGWEVALVPSAVVTHAQGLATARHPYRMLVEHHRSAWLFAWRTMAGWRRLSLPAVALMLGVRLALNVALRMARGSAPR